MTHDRTTPSANNDGDLLARLRTIVGPGNVLEADDTAAFVHEPRGLFRGEARCVVRPKTREEVSAVLAACSATNTPVVPQGGNTGLVGGQTPLADGRAILLSLTRMAALREVDLVTNTMTVEAGMTLGAAVAAAERVERLFPLWFASAGSCTIGGNLATNAGGVNVIGFGNTRDLVNGVEVVLADGRILSDLSKLKKDNTGYDLRHRFIGSEGTLGVITAAVLKLVPRSRWVETAWIGLASPDAALQLLQRAQECFSGRIRAFELIPRIALDFVLHGMPSNRDPLAQQHPWSVLTEMFSHSDAPLRDELLAFLGQAAEDGLIADATVATSLVQAEGLWALREQIPEAQKWFGGSIKHDISVPVAAVPAFLAAVEPAIERAVPGARLCAFGHLGDGNIHCNVQQPVGADTGAFLARWDEVNAIVHALVVRFDGSISAEHGIGQLKRDLLPRHKDPVALAVMRSIKHALDPSGIINPGKLL